MAQPQARSSEYVNDLAKLIEDFPYFQTAHLLYTKQLYNADSIHYSAQLKKSAAYVSDRKVLYKVIHNEFVKDEEPAAKQTTPDQPRVEEESLEVVKTPESTSLAVAEAEQDELEPKDVEVVKVVLEAPEERSTEIPEPDIVNEAEVPDDEMEHELDKVILTSAVESTIQSEVSGEIPEEYSSKRVSDEFDPTKRHSFAEWLKHGAGKEEKAIDQKESDHSAKGDTSDLIDKFIEQEPKMSKPAAAFFSPVDKARQSVTDNWDFVTETLAKIYEKQGDLKRALKAYETLRLKYPEKSSYFAARIMDVEKKLNQ